MQPAHRQLHRSFRQAAPGKVPALLLDSLPNKPRDADHQISERDGRD